MKARLTLYWLMALKRWSEARKVSGLAVGSAARWLSLQEKFLKILECGS
jgi:hypothetical protein